MSIANELITRGWHRGSSVARDGSVCIVGAAAAAHGTLCDNFLESWWSLPALVKRVLWDSCPDERRKATAPQPLMSSPIAFWNDDSTTSYDDVLRVAKEADEILDGLA